MDFSSIKGRYKNIKHFFESILAVATNGYPARNLKVIGVTGTDGKTTTCHLIYSILQQAKYPVSLVSTVAAFSGGKEIDTGFHVTTPDAKFLQPLLVRFVREKVRYLVLETTSHGLDQHRVLGCNFSIGVLTNITHEHLDYHQTFENYRKAKAKLFRGVKFAILNKDDPSFSYIKERVNPQAKIISYSIKRKATIWAERIRITSSGMEFLIHQGKKTFLSRAKIIGDYNVSNILAAIGATSVLSTSWKNMFAAIEEFPGVQGRMEPINEGQNFSVLIDFAHTPNALEKTLKTLKILKPKKSRLIAVFGCAGERDVEKRPIMGEIATKLTDFVVLTAEDPRTEDVNEIIRQISLGCEKAGGIKDKIYFWVLDRQKAIDFAIQKLAKKGDIVVICGKGHEKSMCFGKTEIPWSDQKAVRKALKFI